MKKLMTVLVALFFAASLTTGLYAAKKAKVKKSTIGETVVKTVVKKASKKKIPSVQ
jgi:hypothetical protein